MKRPSKDKYYLGIAEATLERSTCLRRHYGAVIVKNDQIVSTGYNGSPRGEDNCCDTGYCEREAQGVAKGVRVMRVRDDVKVVAFTRAEHDDSAEVNEVEQLSEAEVKAAEEEAALEEKNEVIIENDEPDDEEE